MNSYEFSIARKYLVPRVRQLSVSIISLISVVVIATVVWLSIVFFSAQEGIERRWTEKMIALTAPIRITPTQEYFSSYYFQIDAFSAASDFSYKSLREKLTSPESTPYDPEQDPSLPQGFPEPVFDSSHAYLDLVGEVVKACESIPGVTCEVFETAAANLRLRLMRNLSPSSSPSQQVITQASYLVSFDGKNPKLALSIQKITKEDIQNLLELTPNSEPSLWIEQGKNGWVLPESPVLGDGILLPKSFREAGALIGDRGTVAYQGFGATSMQELRSPVFVAGFYDPGILPIGGKVVLAKPELVARIQQASFASEQTLPSGFNVHIDDLKRVNAVKQELLALFEKKGIAPYWNIQTYEEYDFTKDIFQQMKSDRNLFSLISLIIMIVACSNIVSMLIILVHDKKKEIAILRALGATKRSIALIFGLCGFMMGAFGSIVGSGLAVITLHNLPLLLQFLGGLQGFEVLNTTFYGNNLPTEVSHSAFIFVITSCTIASMIAGIVPAIQASRINTSEALRNE